MEVRVPTIGCSRWHHSSKLVPNIEARCRGPQLWKGAAKGSYRPARWTKAANLVLCMRLLSGDRPGKTQMSCVKSKYDTIIEHMYFIEYPESWCTINELCESWAVEIDLIEESYMHFVELRGVDASDELL